MLRYVIGACLALMPALPAHAADGSLETTSAGSVSVSVFIPPLAAALAAQAQGAAGVWSITGQHNGIMIAFLETEDGIMDSVDIFTRQTTGFELQWDSAMAPSHASSVLPNDGLTQNRFALPDNSDWVTSFTISAI